MFKHSLSDNLTSHAYLETTCEFNLIEEVRSMFNGNIFARSQWRKLVWDRAWALERNEWTENVTDDKHFDLIKRAVDGPSYSIWWHISDQDQSKMRQCETMVKLITHSSLLKGDDGRLRRLPFGSRMCILCELCSEENANHMIMQCPSQEKHRVALYNGINDIYNLEVGECTLEILLGQCFENKVYEEMLPLWILASHYIHLMYRDTIKSRRGIG